MTTAMLETMLAAARAASAAIMDVYLDEFDAEEKADGLSLIHISEPTRPY